MILLQPVTAMAYDLESYEHHLGDFEPPFTQYISTLFKTSQRYKISAAFATLITPVESDELSDGIRISWKGINPRIQLDADEIATPIQHEEKRELAGSFIKSTSHKFAALERCTDRGLRNKTVATWMEEFNQQSYAHKTVKTPNEHATWTLVLLRLVWQQYIARFTDLITFLSDCPTDTAITPMHIAHLGSAIAGYGIGENISFDQAVWRYKELFRHTRISGEKDL